MGVTLTLYWTERGDLCQAQGLLLVDALLPSSKLERVQSGHHVVARTVSLALRVYSLGPTCQSRPITDIVSRLRPLSYRKPCSSGYLDRTSPLALTRLSRTLLHVGFFLTLLCSGLQTLVETLVVGWRLWHVGLAACAYGRSL